MIAFMGFMVPRDGYGYATIKIGEALSRAGEVKTVDMRGDDDWGVMGERAWDVIDSDVAVALCTPDWLPFIRAKRLVAYTMFEATGLPEGWVDKINRYAVACLVPSAWCRKVFVENGVRVPVRVVRWGVDPEDYWLLDRGNRNGRPYTFLWSGTPDKRKGWDVCYRAFWRAFRGSRDVRLEMHFRKVPPGAAGCDDANVIIVEGLFGRKRLRAMLQNADCFVFPSRGEGWGLPPREAAATGLPVIATDFGGLAEEIEHWAFPLRVRGMSRAEYGFWEGDIGEWAEPDEDLLVELMRWCVERRETAAAIGERSAEWMASNATWERTAAGILEEAEKCLAEFADGAEDTCPGKGRQTDAGNRLTRTADCTFQPAGRGFPNSDVR